MRSGLLRLVLLLAAVLAAYFTLRQQAERATPALPEVAAPPAGAAPQPGARLGPCDVAHVTDGDTLIVRCGAREENVRLLQVDTPERDEPLYEEARRALVALIADRPVELELGFEERDDYGRLLAYVFADGENLNLAMIRDGWSPYFDRYGAGEYPREFAEAELAARERELGIWKTAR
jgi:micrococcal nuclease